MNWKSEAAPKVWERVVMLTTLAVIVVGVRSLEPIVGEVVAMFAAALTAIGAGFLMNEGRLAERHRRLILLAMFGLSVVALVV